MNVTNKDESIIKKVREQDWFADDILKKFDDVAPGKQYKVPKMLGFVILFSLFSWLVLADYGMPQRILLVLLFNVLALLILDDMFVIKKDKLCNGEIKYLMDVINAEVTTETYKVKMITEFSMGDVITAYYMRENELCAVDFQTPYYSVEKLIRCAEQGKVELVVKPFCIVQPNGEFTLEHIDVFCDLVVKTDEKDDEIFTEKVEPELKNDIEVISDAGGKRSQLDVDTENVLLGLTGKAEPKKVTKSKKYGKDTEKVKKATTVKKDILSKEKSNTAKVKESEKTKDSTTTKKSKPAAKNTTKKGK